MKKDTYPYVWHWKTEHPERKGQRCRILTTGTSMNALVVQFEDGTKIVASKYAVRRV